MNVGRLAFWIEAIEGRLGRRNDHQSCLAFVINVWPLLALSWGLQAMAWVWPGVGSQYRPVVLNWVQAALGVLMVWLGLMAVASWRCRHQEASAPHRVQMVLVPAVIAFALLTLGYGIVDTPMPTILLALLVLSRALFALRALRWAWGAAMLTLTLGSWLQWRGLMAASPLLNHPMGQQGELTLWWALWARLMLWAALLPLSGAFFMVAAVLHRRWADVEVLARTDALTGLVNRREFMALLEREASRQRRSGHPFSLAIFDLDHFKQVNDRWGHAAGDAVLARLGELLRQSLRVHVDVAARLGGEEFVLMLPDTDLPAAHQVARKICAALHAQPVQVLGLSIPVTTSVGLAEVQQGDAQAALRLADHYLYEAKQAGRARIAGPGVGGENFRLDRHA